jgi:hypothetical protein
LRLRLCCLKSRNKDRVLGTNREILYLALHENVKEIEVESQNLRRENLGMLKSLCILQNGRGEKV